MTLKDLTANESFASNLILSQKYLDDCVYVNVGNTLAEALKDEDLASRFLPMKAWDALKSIMRDGTLNGVLAIENFSILFEPTLMFNLSAFLKEATTGRCLVLKIDFPVGGDYSYYPFPEDRSYYLDLTGISFTTC